MVTTQHIRQHINMYTRNTNVKFYACREVLSKFVLDQFCADWSIEVCLEATAGDDELLPLC